MGMHGEKKHVVELCCFVAHAQHNASRMIQHAYRRLERDREPARRQDGEDSGRDMEAEGREGSNGRALKPEPRKG